MPDIEKINLKLLRENRNVFQEKFLKRQLNILCDEKISMIKLYGKYLMIVIHIQFWLF